MYIALMELEKKESYNGGVIGYLYMTVTESMIQQLPSFFIIIARQWI